MKQLRLWMVGLLLLLWACGAVQAQAVYTPPASGTSLLSTRVVYLSKAGIVADGTTDQTTALQAIFNTNSAGGSLEVVNDLTGTIYTGTLTDYSNTLTRTLAGGKWKLKTNAQGPMFKNATPRRSIPTALLAPTDTNIKFIGGYFDGNNRGFAANGTSTGNPNSAGQYVSIFHMYGVSNLVMEDIETYDPPTYGIHYANIVNGQFRNIRGTIPTLTGGGNDTLHGNGPLSRITIRDVYSSTNDDAVPINLADGHITNTGAAISPDPFGGYVGYGDGTDITIDGVMLAGNSQGIRVLVGAGVRADRITIRNIKGTCASFPIVLDMAEYFTSGSIGSVTVEDVNVQALQQDTRLQTAGYPPCTIYVQAPIDILNVRNLTRNNPYDNRASILLREAISSNPAGSINVLHVDGFSSIGNATGQANTKLIDIRNGASVGQFVANNVNWSSTLSSPGTLLNVATGGTLGPYVVSNSLLPGNATVAAGSGAISTSSKVTDVLTLTGSTTLFSDNFTRTNSSSLGSNYIIPAGNVANPTLTSNAAQFVHTGAGNSFAQIAPSGTALALSLTASTVTWTGSPGSRMVLWSSTDGAYNGYIPQYLDTGFIQFSKQGTPSFYTSSSSFTGQHTFSLTRSGSTFTFKMDGSVLYSFTDATPFNNTAAYLYAGSGAAATITFTNVAVTNP